MKEFLVIFMVGLFLLIPIANLHYEVRIEQYRATKQLYQSTQSEELIEEVNSLNRWLVRLQHLYDSPAYAIAIPEEVLELEPIGVD